MILDQIFMLLADKKSLRLGNRRISKMESLEALAIAKDGTIKGRARDGSPMKAKVTGKSLASRLREEAEKKREAEKIENKKTSKVKRKRIGEK